MAKLNPLAPETGGTPQRLMILCSTTGYQTRAFAETAARMGLKVAFGSDRCHVLDDPWQDGALPLRFERAGESARRVEEYARLNPLDGVVALGDRTAPAAARACELLRLPFHSSAAADLCRDKFSSRARLRAAGLNIPAFERFPLETDPRQIIARQRLRTGFPCVLKPLSLSGSRGVIRASNDGEFIRAFERIRALLRSPDVRVMREESNEHILVESYIDGFEVAVEGLVDRGIVTLLAIFDKPDPLEGPFFEETIYVTPSRTPGAVQDKVARTIARAAEALGLFHGPFHAELRINSKGVWPLEVAARPIGGYCSRVLRLSSPALGEGVPLEEAVIALALGRNIQPVRREENAAGVMMIPVARGGIFQNAEGLEEARATPGIEDVLITIKPQHRLVPFPEGCSYPGFIFARGDSPAFVERALRLAHSKLRFNVTPDLPIAAAG